MAEALKARRAALDTAKTMANGQKAAIEVLTQKFVVNQDKKYFNKSSMR